MEWNSVISSFNKKPPPWRGDPRRAGTLHRGTRADLARGQGRPADVDNQKIEPTVLRFAGNTISVVSISRWSVAILGYFGVQTTTFRGADRGHGTGCRHGVGGPAGELRRGRVPAGAAPLQGRRFHIGRGVTGTVQEIGLFVTTFDTPDNRADLRRE